VTEEQRLAAAGSTDVRPTNVRSGFLAATGGPFGPALLGLLLLAVGVVVRRRTRAVPDLSGL
jgi:hypothetical protein